TLADGTIFAADFGDGETSTTVTVTDGSQTTVTFENEFYTMPNGFYKEGVLTITKELLGADGTALASNETFYAGIFSDSSYTTLATNVSENIVALSLAGDSEVSVEVGVSIGSGETVTLYVTETDEDGNPVEDAEGFAYTVTYTVNEDVSEAGPEVTLDESNTTASVTITNQEIEEIEEEEEEEESEEETETESETETETETESETSTTTAVQTGDETPLLPYAVAMLLAVMVLLAGLIERKRRLGR
ncbi:MAG: hypothetical protein LUG93_04235, partial [Lachnospiraceae bacterium]|nr:hypothetical protein [Lachnospiraceae bacterium]